VLRAFAVALAVALPVQCGGGEGPEPSNSLLQGFRANGLAVTIPSDWYAGGRPARDARALVVASTSPRRTLRDAPAAVVVRDHGWGNPSRRFPPRTAPLRVPGRTSFFRRGRLLEVEVSLAERARPELRRQVAAVVASLRVMRPRVANRPSRALGLPWRGRLGAAVQLTAGGPDHFTWDPVIKRSPNRPWRRWGTTRLLRTVYRVIADHRRANPGAPRVGIGDLSRPHGGDFGPQFGGIGHASHQNGLDVDIYYPRRDRLERAPRRVAQIDRRLAQDLVDRFVKAGAVKVFVGPNTGLRGPPRIVQPLFHHDNHIHVRLGADPPRRLMLGRSWLGRPIHAYRLGNPAARRLLVVGAVHGDEPAGVALTRPLLRVSPPLDAELWVVPTLNPDGLAAGARGNARGVDLNRDFGRFTQRETRIARRLIQQIRPWVSVWFHQPQGLVRAYGPSTGVARNYARLARERYRTLVWPPGTASRWQNTSLGQRSFAVELPAGRLRNGAAARHVQALLALGG
jgi:murein endopeptidase